MKRRVFLLITMMLLMANTAYASDLNPKAGMGYSGESILLPPDNVSSRAVTYQPARGEYLSNGVLEIVNQSNGSVYICVDTLAHTNVDEICHTVFLDKWDDRREDWVQVDYWEFEKTKEDEGGELSMMTDTITVRNVETNKYYRARSLHMVRLNGKTESCSAETDGVLITKD